ncbi:MAG TPA: class I SAM-dependent RNA methyltransferase, partial [Sphingomonas sp.]
RHKLARLSLDSGFGPEARWEPEPVTITLGGVPVPLPPAGFLQATVEGERALVDAVRAAVGRTGIVADLFAGLGTFALSLQNARVYAAEAAREAILSLKAAAGGAQRHLFTEHRDLYRRPLTVGELDRFAAIVLDPPRAGARDQIEQLARSATPVIAYVSCNPSSFARDAKMLCEAGYRLDWIQPVGQFRWSTHVELAARFSR